MSFISKKLLFSSGSDSPYTWNYTRLPGGNWSETNNQYGDWDFGNGRIVQVGQTIAYSDNLGDTWSYVAPSDDFYLLNNIVYGNGKFVSISKNLSAINQQPSYFAAYSADGINWTKVSFPSNFGAIDTLKYSDGKFIVNSSTFYSSGVVYKNFTYSDDGINWNPIQQTQQSPSNGFACNVTYGNGTFLYATGTTAIPPGSSTPPPGPLALYKSSDGINWSQSTISINLGSPEAAVYGDGKFIIFCSASTYSAIYSINNGNTWTTCNIPNGEFFRSIYYANGKFSAVYAPFSDPTQYLLSEDGINWYNPSAESTIVHLTYSNGNYFAINAVNGVWSRSSNFSTWIATNSPVETIWKGLTFGNERFVSAGTSNVGIYSTNGKDWTSFTVPFPTGGFSTGKFTEWHSVIYVNSRLFLFGYGTTNDSKYYMGSYSDDNGSTWNSYLTNRNWTVYYENGMFIGVPYVDVFGYSLDGINWSTSLTSGSFIGLAYGNGKFITLPEGQGQGGESTVAYSSDGITWQSLNSLPIITGNYWKSIAFGIDKFVAISYSTTFSRSYAAYSQDGLSWTLLQLPQKYSGDVFEKIIYADNKFLIISSTKKTVLYSNNGIDWSYYSDGDFPISSSYNKIAYGNNRFVSISNNKIDAAYTT